MLRLHDEVIINGMRLRNRVALPPLTTNYGTAQGLVTDEIIQFYTQRSRDVGLVIVEATAVRADGRIVPGSLGLWEDGQMAGMARLADSIRKLGAAAVLQINHAGARCFPGGGEMQGASPSGFAFRPDVAPFTMSPLQIEQLVADFANAASRAAEAGFDGVEIHGAHLYLISQFLSPLTNRRNDRYGGDPRGRATFALELIRAAREKLGRTIPSSSVSMRSRKWRADRPWRMPLPSVGFWPTRVSMLWMSLWSPIAPGAKLKAGALLSPVPPFQKNSRPGRMYPLLRRSKRRRAFP